MDQPAGFVSSRCPVCADAIGEEGRACPRCATPHHADCWEYSHGCAIYGCVDRPAEELSRVRVAAPDDLSLSMGPHNGARESYEPMPLALVAGFLLTAPLQMLIWAPLPIAAWLFLLIFSRRHWQIDPQAGTLRASIRLFGLPLFRRTVPLSQVRRFAVRQSDTELAVMATLADGAVMSMALGIKMPLTTYRLIDRFECVIQGMRRHLPVHVVRYQAEDASTLPKRIEQLRDAAAGAESRSRAPIAAVLVAEALLLAMCIRMGNLFGSVVLSVHLVPAVALMVWARLLPAGWLAPRLSGWRVTLLENAMRNLTPDTLNVSLSVLAAALLTAYAEWAITTIPDCWGWRLFISAMGGVALAHPWLRAAWAFGCARRGAALGPDEPAPAIDAWSRTSAKAYPFVLAIFFYVLPGICTVLNEPAGQLVTDVLTANQAFQRQGGAWFKAAHPLLTEESADLVAAERARSEFEATIRKYEDRNARRDGIWGAPHVALLRAFRELLAGERRVARDMAHIARAAQSGVESPQELARRTTEIAVGEYEEPGGIAVERALATVIKATQAMPVVPDKVAAQRYAALATTAAFRVSAALAPLERLAEQGTPAQATWQAACARARAKLARATSRLDSEPALPKGAVDIRAELGALMEKARAMTRLPPEGWRDARGMQFDLPFGVFFVQVGRFAE